HVGRAAERLHISQSPLSRQIAQLEERLGLTLFERSQQRIRLTYGEPYGLTIDSEPDEGTTVRIRIPAIDAGVLREGGNGR
ncbi:MAG: LysR family transcriptional regulator, partial [Oscillospiraceae bacterium]